METLLVNILQNGEVEVKYQLWAVFSFGLENAQRKQIWAIYKKLVE